MSNSQSLAPFYAGWETYQAHLVRAVTPLTDDQLSLKSADHMWSVRTLAAHIVAARIYWFHVVMGEGPATLEPMRRWDEAGEPLRSASELVEGLHITWTLLADCLQRWTVDDLAYTFQRPRGDKTYTRQWIIWHVIEHDLHHGGELSFLLGTHHIPAIDL